MLDNLTTRLAKIVKTIRGEARLTEANVQDALREVRIALLEADVALPVVKHFIDQVRQAALGQEVIGSLSPGQALVGVVHRELTQLMGEANAGLDLAVAPPAVILMAGLQGSGKTTTVGKLALLLRNSRRRKCWWFPATCTGRPRSSSLKPWPLRPARNFLLPGSTRSPQTSPKARSNTRAPITATSSLSTPRDGWRSTNR